MRALLAYNGCRGTGLGAERANLLLPSHKPLSQELEHFSHDPFAKAPRLIRIRILITIYLNVLT